MKKKALIILAAILIFVIGEACSFFYQADELIFNTQRKIIYDDQEEGWPMLEVPSVYIGHYGARELAVFVETSTMTELKGHYLPLDEDVSDSTAFTLLRQGAKVRFVSKDVDVCREVDDLQLNDGSIEGVSCQSSGERTSFGFSLYEFPQFMEYDSTRYQRPLFEIRRQDHVHFANVDGYWSELNERTCSKGDMVRQLSQVLKERNLDLYMDVYSPCDDTLTKRPFVMLIHGGAFYYGSRKDMTVSRLCEHLASLGYVAASIDYRIGFQPTKDGVERSGYCAVQDAHAAMRFVAANHEALGIDTSMMFVGGCSAGGITALGLAFMTNDTRPYSTRGSGFNTELGDIESIGNDIDVSFSLKGVVDMWGGMPDLEMLEGKSIPVVAFHGDADDIVPYGYDYPFAKIGKLKKLLVNRMYGSACIVEREKELGVKSKLYTFEGYRHSPQLSADTLNENFYFIQDKMCLFLDEIIREDPPKVIMSNGWYQVDGDVCQCNWTVEGGLVTESEQNRVRIVWMGNAPQCKLKVSGIRRCGVGFTQEVWIK